MLVDNSANADWKIGAVSFIAALLDTKQPALAPADAHAIAELKKYVSR